MHDRTLQGDNIAYDQWAASYDDDVNSWQYKGPEMIVQKLISLSKAHQINLNAKTKILDAGCGTGLVAEKLRSNTLPGIIDGVDLNAEMVKVSQNKQAHGLSLYHDVAVADLLALDPNKKYDIILAGGVFLEGHCGPEHMVSMLNTLKNNGYAILTIRKTFYEANKKGFDDVFSNFKTDIELKDNYLEGAQAYLVTLKKAA